MKKSILVTGGAGFVGTNLIKKLLEEGHTVTSLDNYSTGKRENHIDGCEYFTVDISDPLFPTYGEYDHIFHLGALARIQPSLYEPVHTIVNNFNSTLYVLEYARRNNISVTYAGSSSKHHGLYGSPYAWSKFSGEELCKLYNRVYGLDVAICRFYNVYGPYQLEEGAYSTVVGIFEKQYREGKPLTITGDGEQRRDFTHINDIVSGLYGCMKEDHDADFYELGRGKNWSINELANLFGENYPKDYIPPRAGEYPFTLCDFTKARDELGYLPTHDLDTYIWEKINS